MSSRYLSNPINSRPEFHGIFGKIRTVYMCLVFFCEKRYSLTIKTLRQVLLSIFFCEIMIGLVLAPHFLWINCEIHIFLWILDISSKFIIIHDRMYPWVFFMTDLKNALTNLIPTVVIFCEITELFVKSLNYLWKTAIFCEFFEISGKSIIIYNGMILWILFRDLETILDESGARCPYFLWNRWIICENCYFLWIFWNFR